MAKRAFYGKITYIAILDGTKKEMNAMKILITSDLYSAGPKGKLTANGVITSVKNLQSELERLGHQVRVLTLSDTVRSYKEGKIYYIRSLPALVYPNA